MVVIQMNKPYKISLSIGDFFSTESKKNTKSKLSDINDEQFIYGYTRCFADGLNKNDYYFPLKAIKEASETIIGKPLLVAFNLFNSDGLGGHDLNEVGVGYVPDNAQIKYEKSSDGRTFLCTNFVLWKYYSNNLPKILKKAQDNKKDVSVELFVLDSEYDEKKGYTIVNKFVFCGITILSQDITPAVENAEMQITKFSKKAEGVFEKLNNYLKGDSNKKESPLLLNNSKEENMSTGKVVENSIAQDEPIQEVESKETLDNAYKVNTTTVNVVSTESVYHDDGSDDYKRVEHTETATHGEQVDETQTEVYEQKEVASEGEDEAQADKKEVCEENADKTSDEEPAETEEKELVENATVSKAEYEKLEKEYCALKDSFAELEKENVELKTFKANKEKEENQKMIEFALTEVSDIFTNEEIENWRNQAETFSNIDEFKNALKAHAYDVSKSKGNKVKESMRNALPKSETFESKNSKSGIWGNMENY